MERRAIQAGQRPTVETAQRSGRSGQIGFLSHPHPLIENQFDHLVLK